MNHQSLNNQWLECLNLYPKLNLEEILFESENRFVEQRYGEIRYENDSNEIINLCKFIHENLKLENI